MIVAWNESLRRSLTATLPTADGAIVPSDRRHVLFVPPRYAQAIARDANGRSVLDPRSGYFVAGPLVATDFVPGAAAANDVVG